jgi:hypothetical protein
MGLPRVRFTVPEVCDLASRVESPYPGWIRAYARTTGAVQLLYAAAFAWFASWEFLGGGGEFFHPALSGKGGYSPAYFDWEKLITLALTTLLSLTGLIGGCGLLSLRPWVRRWEAAYLHVLSVGAYLCMAMAAGAVWAAMSWLWPYKLDFRSTVLFTAALGLPYVPFLSEPFVRAATESAALRALKNGPAVVSDDVKDRELYG